MKRSLCFRPALERLEDRWCPSIMYQINNSGTFASPLAVPAVNDVSGVSGGLLNIIDNDSFGKLAITYEGAKTYQVVDNGTGGPTTYNFANVTNLEATMGGIQDMLDVNGNFALLGTGSPLPGFVSVALDGTASTDALANSFTFENALLNGNNSSNNTLYVLGQGGNNKVTLGDGTSSTSAVAVNILYRDAANGPNPGTPNAVNTTNFDLINVNDLVYSSQSATAADHLTVGSTSAAFNDTGEADFSFNKNNNFTMSMAHGVVGNAFDQLTITGGGSGSTLILGDGTTSLKILDAIIIDLDNTSGGMVTIKDNVSLLSATRFDDYQNVSIDVGGGANGVNVGQGLTIWNSDAGSNVTLGGTITGDVTFATGFIAADNDDPGSSAGVSDTLTLQSGAILKGSLNANLNTSQDTVDVGGEITKKLTVNANNDNVNVMVDSTGIIDLSASIALGGNGAKQFYFDGTAGPSGGPPSTTVLTVTSALNSTVKAEIGDAAKVNGGVFLSLPLSNDTVSYDQFATITGTLAANGNSAATSTFYPNGHTAGTGSGQYQEMGFFVYNIGPQVAATSPSGGIAVPPGGLSSIVVTFNEQVIPSSFTTNDVAFTDPSNVPISVSIAPVAGSNNHQFQLSFAPQSALDNYTLVIAAQASGTNIVDAAGIEVISFSTVLTLVNAAPLPISEDFESGVAHHFITQEGTWAVVPDPANAANHVYQSSPAVVGGDAVSTLDISTSPLPASLEIKTQMKAAAPSGTLFSNGFLIFDYQSPTNFKFAGAFIGNQQWVIGQRTGAGWQIQAFANDPSILPGTPYNLRLLLQGQTATLLVNGSTKVSFLFASAFTGSLGLATENSVSQFNDVIVQ